MILDGVDLFTLPEKEMRKIRGKKISMIFQDPMTALNPVFTVGEQIEEVIELHNNKLTKKEITLKAVEMLEMVGISAERFNEYPHQFSGGMKQRVVIAMALACNPELLLADEPTTALDVTIQAQVLEMIARLKEQYNTSMILITHDMGVVAEVCDVVAVVYAGEIVEIGSKEQIFDNPSIRTPGGFSTAYLISKRRSCYILPGFPPIRPVFEGLFILIQCELLRGLQKRRIRWLRWRPAHVSCKTFQIRRIKMAAVIEVRH